MPGQSGERAAKMLTLCQVVDSLERSSPPAPVARAIRQYFGNDFLSASEGKVLRRFKQDARECTQMGFG
jgi:hypothetical protein